MNYYSIFLSMFMYISPILSSKFSKKNNTEKSYGNKYTKRKNR